MVKQHWERKNALYSLEQIGGGIIRVAAAIATLL
jgi:hypothetical protein